MPCITEHTPKVPTRSVNLYARESSPKKPQQDRRTDRQTHGRIVQKHFSRRFDGCTYSTYPKSGLTSNSIFCTMPILPWDMDTGHGSKIKRVMDSPGQLESKIIENAKKVPISTIFQDLEHRRGLVQGIQSTNNLLSQDNRIFC